MICPGCGARASRVLWDATDRLFRTTSRHFQIASCQACRLQFLSPTPEPGEIASYYPEGYWVSPEDQGRRVPLLDRLTEIYRRVVLLDHVRFVRFAVARQRREGVWRGLLDVGCGDGSFLDACATSPSVGLDWSGRALGAARVRGVHGVRGSVDRPPFPARSFSIVTMFHVLEHVMPSPGLESVRQLITPGGSLIVQVPNVGAWQAKLLRGRWAGYDPPRHLIDYSAATLRSALERNGFHVLRETHFSLRDNPTTVANSLVPGLYPPARLARREATRGPRGWLASLSYLTVVLAALPFTLFESAFGHGAAVMMEARVD